MFTFKKAPYKIFALGPKFCWAGPIYIYIWNVELFDSRFDPQNFSPILSSISVLTTMVGGPGCLISLHDRTLSPDFAWLCRLTSWSQ